PFSGACHRNADSSAELWPNSQLGSLGKQQTQLGKFFEDRYHVLTKKLPDQKQPHHRPIFVSIADEQRAIVFQVRKSRHKLCLRSAFQTEAERPSRFENFLDDFMELIHLDRVHTDIGISITRFFNGFAECSVQLSNARAKKILESNEQRKLDSL